MGLSEECGDSGTQAVGRTLFFRFVFDIFIFTVGDHFQGFLMKTDRAKVFFANRYTLSYTAAVLLHLLLFLLYVPLKGILVPPRATLSPRPEAPPVAFEFVEAPEQRPSERPPKVTPLLSDRQSIAQDRQNAPLDPSHLPYSEGLVDSRDHLRTVVGRDAENGAGGEGTEGEEAAEASEQQSALFREWDRAVDFSSVLKEGPELTPQERQEAVYGTPAIPPSLLQLDNQESSALQDGGLQLSTYDWDFAPYLAYLKRHIGSHVFPPEAFTKYGLIEGKTLLRFKILRDGTMRDLEVLKYQGSGMLRDTSHRAVVLSAPFRVLPDHFPDEYLEITGLFNYSIIRNIRQE